MTVKEAKDFIREFQAKLLNDAIDIWTDENETYFTIAQIKKICDVCGKPFEEVFKERENKVDENA